MTSREFTQLKSTDYKSNSQTPNFGIKKSRSRTKFFIGSAIIISCTAFYQSGTKAQLQSDFLPKGELAESVRPLPAAEKENHTDSAASRTIPSIYPVAGRLTDAFGRRANPFGGGNYETHSGLYIAALSGTLVSAAADGTVVFAGWQRGYGNGVIVDHGNGLSTRYGHLSRVNTAAGRTITRGDELGEVGSTGRSTGAHLHYEVRDGKQAVDPARYLPPTN